MGGACSRVEGRPARRDSAGGGRPPRTPSRRTTVHRSASGGKRGGGDEPKGSGCSASDGLGPNALVPSFEATAYVDDTPIRYWIEGYATFYAEPREGYDELPERIRVEATFRTKYAVSLLNCTPSSCPEYDPDS